MFRNYSFDPKSSTNSHTFEVHDIDLSIINGIRRVILTDIPIVGIIGETVDNIDPTVDIIVNTCPLHNEIITHRIGLIPICLKEEEIESYQDGTIELELNVLNEGNKIEAITTKNIKAKRNGKDITDKELKEMFPPNAISNDNILITRLRSGEQLHFKAQLVKKTARFNSSFNPVSLCNFSYIQNPEEADKKEGILNKERAYYKNKFGDPIAFLMDIEHINKNVAPKYLINKSIEIIIEKLNNIRNNLIKDDNIKVKQFQEIENTYEFFIDDEDDTLGCIIQSIIHSKYIRNKNKFNQTTCSYIGYICPHPLKSLLVIRITLDDETRKASFINFLEMNCKMIIDELISIKSTWNKFVIENKII